MSEANRYTTNPETGRRICIGGVTFNNLTFTTYDFINGELVRRENAPPPSPRIHYYNTVTDRLIRYGTRTYFDLIRAGWEILEGYYLIPPDLFRLTREDREDYEQFIATIQDAGHELEERRRQPLAQRTTRQEPANFEDIMAVHGERLANLNVTLCRECLYAIKPEDGDYCNDCRPE